MTTTSSMTQPTAGLPAVLTDPRAGATAREIAQQPQVWRQVAADAASGARAVRAFLDPLLAREDLRIVLTGAGTSAFIGEILAPELTGRLGRRVDAVATTDIVSNPREAFAEDVPTLLVSFARSGDSPESLAATALADRTLTSLHHLVVTCNPDGALARAHGDAPRSFVLLTPEGTNDEGFAMTSSFTSMTLATWLALAPDAAPGAVDRVADAGQAVLREHGQAVADLVSRGYQRVVYLGSGPLTGLARESALKLLELTGGSVVSYYDSALGFRHGPKSVVDEHTLAVVFLSNDAYTRKYDDDIVAELRQQMGERNVVVVGAAGHDSVWTVPGIGDLPDALAALPYVLVAQLFALGASLALGFVPDSPSPSGTVNRVVKGVTVHPYDEGK